MNNLRELVCIWSDWKSLNEWIKILRRLLHQIQGNWAGRNFVTESGVNSRLMTHARMNLKSATANGLNFKIINWLMEFWWGTLDLAWLIKHGLDDDFHTPDSGRVLDSKKGFGFWILGSVVDSGKCFLDSGKCFGFREVFCVLCFAYSSVCSTIKYLSWRSGF